MGHIFISYSHEDNDYVIALKQKLQDEGFLVWLDQHNIPFGNQWPPEIEDAIKKCDAFIVVMSKAALRSPIIAGEISYALDKGKKIFPLLYNGEPFLILRGIQYENVMNGSLPSIKFYEDLRRVIGAHSPSIDWKVFLQNIKNIKEIERAIEINNFIEIKAIDKTNNYIKPANYLIDIFLDENKYQVLFLKGDALVGKTSLVGNIINRQIENGLREIDEKKDGNPPSEWLPVYFSLRDLQDIASLADLYIQLEKHIKYYLRTAKPLTLRQIIETKNTKWVFYFDGVDEIWDRTARNRFINALREFTYEFSSVKIILTSRPSQKLKWQNIPFQEIEMKHLEPEKIIDYISDDFLSVLKQERKARKDNYEQVLSPIKITLRQDSNLQLICGIPGYMSLLSKWLLLSGPSILEKLNQPINEKKAPAIPTGLVLKGIYLELWKREEGRREDEPTLLNKTEEFAARIDGKHSNFRKKDALDMLDDREFDWLENLGIIKRNAEGQYRFYLPITAITFASMYIVSCIERKSSEYEKYTKDFSIDFKKQVSSFSEDLLGMPVDLKNNFSTQTIMR